MDLEKGASICPRKPFDSPLHRGQVSSSQGFFRLVRDHRGGEGRVASGGMGRQRAQRECTGLCNLHVCSGWTDFLLEKAKYLHTCDRRWVLSQSPHHMPYPTNPRPLQLF